MKVTLIYRFQTAASVLMHRLPHSANPPSRILPQRGMKMNIIEIKGGLGNQMFQAALCVAFLKKGIDAAADFSFYQSGRQERELALNFFPNFCLDTADEKKAARLRGYGYNESIFDKIGRKLLPSTARVFQEDVRKGYQPEVFDKRDTYISGYWQCEKYFSEYRKDILEIFCFPEISGGSVCCQIRDRILEDDGAVSLHVRRGDYLNPKYENVYRDVCTEQYYKNAISYMRMKNPQCHFYVFSDDIPWCREHLGKDNMIYVDCNRGENSPYDMYLMSICRHNIIANSSFSWWGAWLNQTEGKEILAPERWFHHMDVCDQICDSWIRISST